MSDRLGGAKRLESLCELTVATAIFIAVGGCDSHSDRLKVSGEVLLNGAPLKRGSIRLTLVGGQEAAATGAMIRDGEYLIPREKGLAPGQYHVVISAADEDAPRVMARDASGRPSVAVAQELIPAEYNINSQKMIEVTVDGSNHFIFDIESGAAS